MAPLSPAAIASLSALTIHYSVLSIVLHLSRTSGPGSRYNASSCVALTELFKVGVCTVLVLWNGELRPLVLERKRLRAEREVAEGEGGYIPLVGIVEEKGQEEVEREWGEASQSQTVVLPRRRTASAEGYLQSPGRTTSFEHKRYKTPGIAVIPPTPGGTVLSPRRIQNGDALRPEPDVFDLTPIMTSSPYEVLLSTLLDFDVWISLKDLVLGPGWWKLAVPSILFVFQSNAQYLASSNLSVPTFQLAYQLKIPATALCSVFLLKRSLSSHQWISLFTLTLGVGIVQLHSSTPSAPPTSTIPIPPLAWSDNPSLPKPNPALGLFSVIAACLSSGFASTYFERVLKTPASSNSVPAPSIWIRNIQLSLFGLLAGLPIIYYELNGNSMSWAQWEGTGIDTDWWEYATGAGAALTSSFFEGFTSLTWLVICLQVTGGLLGALVMAYADNILKCFSTSISILISFIASMYLFAFKPSPGVAAGACLVLFSTYVYAQPPGWNWTGTR